jgi:phytoene synthase
MRLRVHALYGFVRIPDEWVDNPATKDDEAAAGRLGLWRSEFLRGVDGVRPESPVLRAFCDVVREARIPVEEPLQFLSAMESDLRTSRYATYEDLRAYMRGSAASVGVMMCHLVGAPLDQETLASARALGEAMQLTNFLRDVGEDAQRGRIYLPLEDLAACDVDEWEVIQCVSSPRLTELLKYEIQRARALYALADTGIPALPAPARRAIQLARVLYARILDRIESRNYDVFSGSARMGSLEKVLTAARVLLHTREAPSRASHGR